MGELLNTPCSTSDGVDVEGGPIWIEDEHPLTGDRCLTLHICGIYERMNILTNKYTIDDEGYLLKWFSFIGPYIGICWKTELFESLNTKMRRLNS